MLFQTCMSTKRQLFGDTFPCNYNKWGFHASKRRKSTIKSVHATSCDPIDYNEFKAHQFYFNITSVMHDFTKLLIKLRLFEYFYKKILPQKYGLVQCVTYK